jgi:predicted ArsR family transcriptional regulator
MTETRDRDLVALAHLAEPIRRDLYDWVVAQDRPVGREEAATAVGITRALAAFHLDRLATAGLLDSGYRRLTGRVGPGAGRPARVYWRAGRQFSVALPERRYERAAQLFATALERLGDDPLPVPLQEAAREFGERLGAAERRGSPAKRLTAALRAGGYEPVTDETGTIHLRNCPFDALADAHRPLVCGTNMAIADGLLRGSGATALRPVLDSRPGWCCVVFIPDDDGRGDA